MGRNSSFCLITELLRQKNGDFVIFRSVLGAKIQSVDGHIIVNRIILMSYQCSYTSGNLVKKKKTSFYEFLARKIIFFYYQMIILKKLVLGAKIQSTLF